MLSQSSLPSQPKSFTPSTRIRFQPQVRSDVLCFWERTKPASQQAPSIPTKFRDAMAMREEVFVNEIKAIPIEHHMDSNEGRAFHWVLYSANPETGDSLIPIGSIRLLPFPQYPKPTPEAHYYVPPTGVPLELSESFFSKPAPLYAVDRATSLHDGKEPYLKLERLCVLREYRAKKAADLLVRAALDCAKGWNLRLRTEAEVDGDREGQGKMPEWKGLICIHAHEKAVSMWTRHGFVRDEEMGVWYEAGMKVCGMFLRLEIKEAAV
jgi:GNAT superfamily N-acetyltransferase